MRLQLLKLTVIERFAFVTSRQITAHIIDLKTEYDKVPYTETPMSSSLQTGKGYVNNKQQGPYGNQRNTFNV
jgi:hypothetical protein